MSVANADSALRFGITEESIVEKTGITERRYHIEGGTSDMIVEAAINCLQSPACRDVSPNDIDCVLVATMTPDYRCPSTASLVHEKLGTINASGFDIMATCSGFMYALQIATSFINSGAYKNILVCAADQFSSIIDPSDKRTVVIFGDGAGVSLLQYSDTRNDVIDTLCRLDSVNQMDVCQRIGGSNTPLTEKNISERKHFLRFESRGVAERGVELFDQVIMEILAKNKMSFKDVDYIVTHQANKRILEMLADKLRLPVEKFIINIETIGNTSAASIPIAISEALQSNKLKGNETLLLSSVGAGYTYAAGLIKLRISS